MQDDFPIVGDDSAPDSVATTAPRLVHLRDARDLEVAQGDRDIRGWDLRTAGGEKVGKVRDLIIDRQLMKVCYIEATIDREALNSASDRRVAIPIGSARLDDEHDNVFLSAAIVDPRALPVYDEEALARAYLGGAGARRSADSAEAVHSGGVPSSMTEEAQFFGQRRRGREGFNYVAPLGDPRRLPIELP